MSSLYSFLSSIHLQKYHEAFLKAGASDSDMPLLIQFTDMELVEFVTAIKMLPFHAIKFKRAVRDLKQPKIQTLPSSNSYTTEFIASNSIIYGKNAKRALTSYEEAINRASFQLAFENPLLMSKKGDLFEQAKKKLMKDGYQYKRGKSRSKLTKLQNNNGLEKQQQCKKHKDLMSISSFISNSDEPIYQELSSSPSSVSSFDEDPPQYYPSVFYSTI